MSTTEAENPLVAKSESPSGLTTGFGNPEAPAMDRINAATAGSGMLNDVASTVTDFRKGDWVNAGFDLGTDALDLLGAAMDPLGTLASAGVGWLIEHISFLKEGLDALAGNPEAVTAKAVTWSNISKQLTESAEAYEKSTAKLTSEGTAAEAYQGTAKGYADTLRGAATHADAASTAMNVGAALVGTERGLIRDMISSFVGGLILKGLAAIATSWCSFGGSVAAFIADTVLEGASLAEKITTKIAKIVQKLEELAKGAGKSKGALEAAANALKKLGKGTGKIAEKGLDTAAKLDAKGRDLKEAAAAHPMSAKEKLEDWKDKVPHTDKLPGQKYAEPNRNVLNPEKWQEAHEHVKHDGWEFHAPKWNAADTAGVGAEARRQENEQPDRYGEASEAYEKEHGEE
ncbi:hypothetical protein [Amycolatopsis sp. CA-230715]|uniref:hypothetical protein n=1 Tax=Amycolatopsis sp. CA-230715 TaxID=2745196 RepID=UPI001C011202|nr:hypothetical protein [Amycolatopsis sp. CA-230715]QWF80039.1 hypothetical protein HUW46_03454 [Amycolatopsis sp. CA-230715]